MQASRVGKVFAIHFSTQGTFECTLDGIQEAVSSPAIILPAFLVAVRMLLDLQAAIQLTA